MQFLVLSLHYILEETIMLQVNDMIISDMTVHRKSETQAMVIISAK